MKQDFVRLLEESVGSDSASTVLEALEEAPAVSVRYNPAKYAAPEGKAVPWSPYGLFLPDRPSFTLDPLFHAGAYYVQDSSAMFTGRLFREVLPLVEGDAEGNLRALDLCAAPGGKTTDILTSLQEERKGRYVLVSNEISPSRATVLCDNAARWGDSRLAVTSADPAAFSRLEGYFDIIVADVPCSGEGMFRKDSQALMQWSLDNVALCQARQMRIISDVWPSLKEGGVLIYSTCTFNHFENIDNVRRIASKLGADIIAGNLEYKGVLNIDGGYALLPGLVPGEGQFCAALRKTSASKTIAYGKKPPKPEVKNIWLREDATIVRRGELLCALTTGPLESDAAILEKLRPIRMGTAVGTIKGKDIIPHADLALAGSLSENAFVRHEVSLETALAFLHRESFRADGAPSGYLLITYKGLPLGFVKNLGSRCNNLLPQGRRIRMDI